MKLQTSLCRWQHCTVYSTCIVCTAFALYWNTWSHSLVQDSVKCLIGLWSRSTDRNKRCSIRIQSMNRSPTTTHQIAIDSMFSLLIPSWFVDEWNNTTNQSSLHYCYYYYTHGRDKRLESMNQITQLTPKCQVTAHLATGVSMLNAGINTSRCNSAALSLD